MSATEVTSGIQEKLFRNCVWKVENVFDFVKGIGHVSRTKTWRTTMKKHSLNLKKAIYFFANAPENKHLTLRELAKMLNVSASYVCQLRQDDQLELR